VNPLPALPVDLVSAALADPGDLRQGPKPSPGLLRWRELLTVRFRRPMKSEGEGGRQRAYGLVDLLAEVGLPSVAVLVLRGSLPLRHL
jgi:hypothetical protein